MERDRVIDLPIRDPGRAEPLPGTGIAKPLYRFPAAELFENPRDFPENLEGHTRIKPQKVWGGKTSQQLGLPTQIKETSNDSQYKLFGG